MTTVPDILRGPLPPGICPACHSANVITLRLPDADQDVCGCRECQTLFAPVPDHWAVTPCRKMCGDCAFRKGSPERADPYGWMRLTETFEMGRVFFCHRGVPMSEDGRYQIKGSTPGAVALQAHVCAGWLAAQTAGVWPLAREGIR